MPRQGLQEASYLQEESVVIRPTLGMVTSEPADRLAPGASPDMLNCTVVQGRLQKRPGFAQYRSGNSAQAHPIIGLFSTQDSDNNTHLIALRRDGGRKYNIGAQDWDELTVTLTGSDTNLFSFEKSQNAFVFSQGVDKVVRLAFNTLISAGLNANCPAAKYLVRFNQRLNLGYTLETAVNFPYRHKRSVAQDHTDWTGTGSGSRDEDEFQFYMRGMRKLGERLAIYYEKMIELVTPIPDANAPFAYRPLVTSAGLYAPFTLKGWKEIHGFLGTDDVYAFDGAQITAIMPQVRDTIFTTLNASKVDVMFAEVYTATQEYIMFLCTGSATIPNVAWVFNYARGVAYPWSVNGPRSATIHRLDATIGDIDHLVGTIDEQTYEFDAQSLTQSFPALLTGHENGKVYLWSASYFSDDDSSIPCRWTSHDLTSENVFGVKAQKITVLGIDIEYQGTSQAFELEFSISDDGGTTWTSMGTMTGLDRAGVLVDSVNRLTTGNRLRFKFENDTADETFRIISMTVRVRLDKAGVFEP